MYTEIIFNTAFSVHIVQKTSFLGNEKCTRSFFFAWRVQIDLQNVHASQSVHCHVHFSPSWKSVTYFIICLQTLQ